MAKDSLSVVHEEESDAPLFKHIIFTIYGYEDSKFNLSITRFDKIDVSDKRGNNSLLLLWFLYGTMQSIFGHGDSAISPP